MRRPLRSLAFAASAAMAAMLVLPVPASAGGPTSVLIVSPTTGQTASLYHDDPDYALLLELLEPVPAPVEKDVNAGVGPGTQAINVTWLVHDVVVWRVDRIDLDAKNGLLINTNVSNDAGLDVGAPGTWHRSSNPERLMALVKGLLLEPPNGSMSPAASTAEIPTSVGGTAANDDGWWWALPALAGGLAVGLVGRPHAAAVVQRWRERDRGARHQLIDL